MDSLLLSFGAIRLEWHTALLSFLLAFILSSLVAYIYDKTFQGLSFSRGMLESMVLGSMIACLLMIAIGDNVARGIGIVGSLAIIRFRTNLRDPRDLIFLFAALGIGVTCGVQSYSSAIIGTLLFCCAALLLNFSQFGAQRKFDGLVRFQIPTGAEASNAVSDIMAAVPKSFALVTLRNVAQGDMVDCAYQVKLAKEGDSSSLIRELEKIEGVRGLTYMNQQTTVEI